MQNLAERLASLKRGRPARAHDHPGDGDDDDGTDDGDDETLEVEARDVSQLEHGAGQEPADDGTDDAEDDHRHEPLP